jgi:hypothetical protein
MSYLKISIGRAAKDMTHAVQEHTVMGWDTAALFDTEADALSYLAWLQSKSSDAFRVAALT